MLQRLSGTVLSVWAHPDDETFLSGGLMAQAVEDGHRVVCVTATRGEQGSTDEQRWPNGEPLATVRTAELAAALAALGVTEHHWLDYPDGGCHLVGDDEPVARIRALVDDVRPDHVLTFGPEGMTGHDDHKTVSRWASAAAVGSGAVVHWATQSPQWVTRFQPTLEQIGTIYPGATPPVTPEDEMSVLLRLDGAALDRKVASMLHQTSQIDALISATSLEFFRGGIAEEAFRPAP